MTDAERRLWAGLREAFPDAHWRHQIPFGRYIVDFCAHSARLIIEVDGGQHSSEVDAPRTRFLEAQDYRVLRFWNNEILQNLDGVLQSIRTHLRSSLVGKDPGGGPAASAAAKTPARPSHKDEGSAP